MSDTPKDVTIGGRVFRLPMLTLGGLKRVAPALKIVKTLTVTPGEIPDAPQIEAMIDIVFESAKKGDPTLVREEFIEFIEGLDYLSGLGELADAFAEVAMSSGLQKAQTAGDSPGGASPESSTSPTSTG